MIVEREGVNGKQGQHAEQQGENADDHVHGAAFGIGKRRCGSLILTAIP
jgi:hypothetical protein